HPHAAILRAVSSTRAVTPRLGVQKSLLALLWLACALPLAAQTPPERATPPTPAAADTHVAGTRPRIGLVLSGGGARGAAHVGVLKVLEDLHIPIDAIAGTSMGAVVGGLYASGLNARQIEKLMTSLNWQDA